MLRANLVILLVLCLAVGPAEARKAPEPVRTSEAPTNIGPFDGSLAPDSRFALAATNTTLLASFSFDVGSTCSQQGWTVVDATAQVGTFWHVDDFVGANVNPGDSLAVLAGTKSLWCGARAATPGVTCGYLTLPGYGNRWNQAWQTKTCVPVTGMLDVSFLIETDSDEWYDATFLEYTTDCTAPFSNWTVLYGDDWYASWSGKSDPMPVTLSVPINAQTVKVRLHFDSSDFDSDEDGDFDSHAGPVIIDNLVVEGLALEDFEDEAVGAVSSEDWEADVVPGYGASFLALFRGSSLVQQDMCARNLSCVWSAVSGSQQTYACGGFPQQKAVPMGDGTGQYLCAEIWSPSIPLVGTGNVVNLQFTVYRDMTLDGLVFYAWGVRSDAQEGCSNRWRSRNYVYYGSQKDWYMTTFPVGDLLDLSSASEMQVKLIIVDECASWCGVFGAASCHSHAPLFDNVKVYRVDIVGPVWSTRDIDMFQDTFPTDGSDSGIGRADAALSITASASHTILPGDSVRVIVNDPITATADNPSGLSNDLGLGGKQVYLWVHVIDSGVPSPTKTGAALTDNPDYPFTDTQVADGRTWTRIRCRLVPPTPVNTNFRFVVDLNDNLFEAGDVIEFFFGATNTNGQTSYCSGPALNYVQSDVDLAAETAAEFTILPLNGNGTFGNDILYIDGMDGRGAQVYWDTAFEQMGLAPDRYDVRGPSSSVSNRPGTRVKDVSQQLNGNYQVILWDAGDLTQSLGDGTGAPEKSNDYAMVNSFLAGLTTPGGIYICGDDYFAGLNAAAGAPAVTFKSTYLTYSFVTGNHRPSFGISPVGTGVPGGAFANDTFAVSGACPLINDFDVVTATASTIAQMTYGTPASNNGAVISKTTGNARVMGSGFSFIYIRDDDADGVMDRADHLRDILSFMVGNQNQLTDVPRVFSNRLEQNYPNPFNPQTTIAFSLKQHARVRIDVYSVDGALVRTLVDETRAAGSYTDVRWDGRNADDAPVASGVYLCRLMTDGFSQTRKLMLLK